MILILEAASNRQGFVSLSIMIFLLELVDHLVVQQTLVFGITVIVIPNTTRLNMNTTRLNMNTTSLNMNISMF